MSPKIIDMGTNRKRLFDFLVVRHSNIVSCAVSVILHVFCHHPYSALILEVFPLDQIAHVEVNPHGYLKLTAVKSFSKYANPCDHCT